MESYEAPDEEQTTTRTLVSEISAFQPTTPQMHPNTPIVQAGGSMAFMFVTRTNLAEAGN